MKGKHIINRRKFLSGLGLGLVASINPIKKPGEAKNADFVELLSPEGEVVSVNKSLLKEVPKYLPHKAINGDLRKGIKGRKFVMVIDLSKCKRERKCQSACNKMHNLTDSKNWVKVYKMQNNDRSAPYWQPTICMHCDEPPCVKVCPVDATFKRQDGIVHIDNNRCIGCRFCMAACPYSTRVFNWNEELISNEKPHSDNFHYVGAHSQLGTVEKCDFCPQMAADGKLPLCVTSCPNGVFYYGDENEDAVTNGDETVQLSQLLKDKGGYRLLEDLGTKPRVYYLPPVNRLFPFEAGLEENISSDEE